MDLNGNSVQEEECGVKDLKDWLFDRVGDDNDVVIDDLQEEFGAYFDQLESQNPIDGTDEYQVNMKHLNGLIRELKTPEGCEQIKVKKDKQKITDGTRPCYFGGTKDAQGFPHGEGMLAYENKDTFVGKFSNGVLNREGKFCRAQECGLNIEGKWVDGLMEGEMRVETMAGGWIEGYWHHGVPHGFQREFGVKEFTMAARHSLRFVGRFYRGVARGICWKGLFAGGFICGHVDTRDGTFSGDDIAYIYPDFKTALRGKFKDEKLVKAQICQLTGCKFVHGIAIPTFTKPSGQVYEFEEPSRMRIAKNPTLPDPWEQSIAYVSPSLLPQGGDGLFARVFRPKGAVLSFYNGIRLNTSSLLLEQRFGHSDYRIRLHAEADLDIPKGFEDLNAYSTTLGHKANHSFSPNTEWIVVEHPRFGLIRGLRAIQDIAKDEEILVNYSMNLADSPEWYRIVWLKHQRQVKKASDEAIQRILDRYYENSGKRVIVPKCEELNVPEPQGISNLDDLPDDAQIEAETPKALVMEIKNSQRIIKEIS